MYLLSYFFPLIFIFILSVCSSQVSTSHRAGTTLKCQEEQNIQMQNLFPDYSDAKAIPRTCRAYFTQPGNLIFAKRFWFWFGSNQIVGQSLQRHCKWRVHRQFGTKERKHLNNTWSQYKFQSIWVRVGHSDAVHLETFGLCAVWIRIWAESIKYVRICVYLD